MKKWLKIIHFSIFLTGLVCFDNLFGLQQIQNNKIVKKQDPQEWHQKMIQKYPKAGLEKIKLVAGRSWAMGHFLDGTPFITCPYDTYDGFKSFTPDDELALLHEAGHARNHRWTKALYKKSYQKKLMLGLMAASFLGTDGVQKSKDLFSSFSTDNKNDIAEKIIKISLLYGVLSSVIYKFTPSILKRIDETLADDFANQHGDADALKGGYYHFMQHAHWQKMAYKNWLHRWKKDFGHPASYDRAQEIAKVLWSKHGQPVPLMI